MSFNVNNLHVPLAPQSKEISDSCNRDYSHKSWTNRHVQELRQESREPPYMATPVSFDLFLTTNVMISQTFIKLNQTATENSTPSISQQGTNSDLFLKVCQNILDKTAPIQGLTMLHMSTTVQIP